MKNFFLLTLILLFGLSMLSCIPDGDRSPAGQGSSSCPNPDKMRRAVCADSHDWAGNAWSGTEYCSENTTLNHDNAQKEVDAHNRNNPGHHASVDTR